jgi:predicted phosphohydrolase
MDIENANLNLRMFNDLPAIENRWCPVAGHHDLFRTPKTKSGLEQVLDLALLGSVHFTNQVRLAGTYLWFAPHDEIFPVGIGTSR